MKPIQVGDMVVVVRAHCQQTEKFISHIFVVSEIGACYGTCNGCGANLEFTNYAVERTGEEYDCSTLKRLDPDALKDDVPEQEELRV